MQENALSLESVWDFLLSREPEQICRAFSSLDDGEKLFVLEHLRRMQTEPGWYPQQRQSAIDALKALGQI
jgi:hypothetical protein